MPLHHTLLLPSSDRNPLTFESPLERFDNLSRNRTKRGFSIENPLFVFLNLNDSSELYQSISV